MVDDGADGGDAAEGDYQESEDEPSGAAAGLVVRLGDAEGAEEGAGHVFKQMHGFMVALVGGRLGESGGMLLHPIRQWICALPGAGHEITLVLDSF